MSGIMDMYKRGSLVGISGSRVTKLRLKPPRRDRRTGESSLPGGRSAAATKTASKGETCLIRNHTGFRRCPGVERALIAHTSTAATTTREDRRIRHASRGTATDDSTG